MITPASSSPHLNASHAPYDSSYDAQDLWEEEDYQKATQMDGDPLEDNGVEEAHQEEATLEGTRQGADLIPVTIAGDFKTMGSLPRIFTGDCTRANDFIEEVQGYLCLNQDVAGFNSSMKKVSLTLTLIKRPEVA